MAPPLSDPVKRSNLPSGRPIVLALLALLVLTGLSWGLAHLPLGAFDTAAALGIAVVKASVVAFVFMELIHTDVVPRFVVLATLLFIVLMCAGIVTDVYFR
jgi:cytochrome c oxidase subunit IV